MSTHPNAYPFSEIPPAGMPMTDLSLSDTLRPLLHGTYALVYGFAEGCLAESLDARELHNALTLIAGQLALACQVLDRWNHDAGRGGDEEE